MSKRDIAVQALMDGASQEETAERAGVTARTVRRWLGDSAFAEVLRDERRSVFRQAVNVSAGKVLSALAALDDVIQHPEQRGANVKRLAARDMLEIAFRLSLLDDIETRLERLEDGY